MQPLKLCSVETAIKPWKASTGCTARAALPQFPSTVKSTAKVALNTEHCLA